MKKLLIPLICAILFGAMQVNAEATPKDTTEKNTTVAKVTEKTVKQNCDSCAQIHQLCFRCNVKRETASLENLIAFLPVIIYLLFLYLLRNYLHQSGFRLADALTENFAVEQTKTNTNPATAAINPVVTTKELPKSTSRLIVFISGFTTITIAACFTTYYMYIFFATGCPPDLEHLTNILLTLGLGVVPYALNKITTALKIN